ncbi:MAG: acetyl-CoA carboxylase biotin carboxyl carrier protein subunit [Planctomycetota bacterium]
MEQEYLYNSETLSIKVERKNDAYQATIQDRTYSVQAESLSPNLLSLLIDGRSVLVHTAEKDGERIVCIGGVPYVLLDPASMEDYSSSQGEAAGGNGVISTPMPGKIVAVHVKEGDAVKAGQALMVVESMKMQNDMVSNVNGIVKKVHFKPGDQASFGDPLVEIDVEEA